MSNQFLVDTIYNHGYMRKFLSILRSVKKNDKFQYIMKLCENTNIEEDEELYNVFINELHNISNSSSTRKKPNDSSCNESTNNTGNNKENGSNNTHFEDMKDINSSISNNSEEINEFEIDSSTSAQEKTKETRIYVDGIFDLSHSGHFNAMRQAKKLGDIVVVGINSDEDALNSKGVKPIYTQEERGALIAGCKWVDEVIIGTKYNVDMDLLEKYNCDYAAHGTDLAYDKNGTCCYEEVRKFNKLKIFERSYGISTTTIINHLLQAVNNSNYYSSSNNNNNNTLVNSNNNDTNSVSTNEISDINNETNYVYNTNTNSEQLDNFNKNKDNPTILEITEEQIYNSELGISDDNKTKVNEQQHDIDTLPKSLLNRNRCHITTSQIYQFIDNNELIKKKKNKKVVYVDGSFDIFHIGHLRILENAKKLGDYLLVGMHSDEVVQKMKGKYFPVVSLLERTLNVLAMKVVDDVVIGAPWVITESFIKRFHIDVVVRGTIVDYIYSNNEIDPYDIPKKLNIYQELSSESNITTYEIIQRIEKNKKYLMRNMSKRNKKEESIWETSNTYAINN
ncbi:ethanolamine-phosphate cytidylyltransferase [Plasmodium reichenowi]|uniref:ethanolamine-phosphate cytidylyltransferase n=1 Tax=Plasmodium reichenowi TaxID=5854 RepID=A0A060S349_PLARE|nr:ethanolamine-phosphate cytidylyltransferase, putative [Plasmodium reichenowi]KYN94899.1 ethanolamine-phosphate cytidylyltransferase, putative [Plasmodium reichenowi]CDO66261.1 ethanolamine-phosphate cytidylyltransferase, putative [Plasmodium reichenowi]SOV82105.1 ethanolamine-phosphate cytidylyltransferase [Plasmodium reichenowi]